MQEPLRPAHLPPLSVGISGSRPRSFGVPVRDYGKPALLASQHAGLEIPVREGGDWDEDDDHLENAAEKVLSNTTPFECTTGSKGVTALKLSGIAFELTHSGSLGLGETMGAGETMSSSSVIRGSNRKWCRGEALGKGSLGTVYQAMDQATGQMFAVKEVAINPSDAADLKWKDDLENEIRICKDLSHPRIVAFLGHDYIDSCLYIYLEYMPGGSMADVLSQFGPFEESLITVYTRELMEGLEYLHTRQPPVVHRDVKGANVLVGLDCGVKLSDFGCSKRAQETMSHTLKGSIPWMAPEVINNTGYGRSADIWSFGCVVIEMATAKSPWGNFDNPMAAMWRIGMSNATPAIPAALSETCQAFIGLCVQRDATKRPTSSELLQHDFIRDLVLDS